MPQKNEFKYEFENLAYNLAKLNSYRAVARLYNCSPATIESYAIRMGLPRPDRVKRANSFTPTEAAYIAGIIDGEGCIHIRKVKTRNGNDSFLGSLIINNTKYDLIEYLKKTIGAGGISYLKRGLSQYKSKDRWEYRLHGKACYDVLEQVLPYLLLKNQQAQLALELHNLQKHSNRNGQFNPQRQLAIYETNKTLNRRGR